jgi:hypothetical protein
MCGLLAFMTVFSSGRVLKKAYEANQNNEDELFLEFQNDKTWQGWDLKTLANVAKITEADIFTVYQVNSQCQFLSNQQGDLSKFKSTASLLPKNVAKNFLKNGQFQLGSSWTLNQILQKKIQKKPILISDVFYKKIIGKTDFLPMDLNELNQKDLTLFCAKSSLNVPVFIQGVFNQKFHNLSLYGDFLLIKNHLDIPPNLLPGQHKLAIPVQHLTLEEKRKLQKQLEPLLDVFSPPDVSFFLTSYLGERGDQLFFKLIEIVTFILSTLILSITSVGLMNIQITKIQKTWKEIALQRTLGLSIFSFSCQIYLEIFLIGLLSLSLSSLVTPPIVKSVTQNIVDRLPNAGFQLDPFLIQKMIHEALLTGFFSLFLIVLITTSWPLQTIKKIDLGQILRKW